MTKPESILKAILDGVDDSGCYSIAYANLANGVWYRSASIKSEADVKKWARENNLQYEVEEGMHKTATVHFSRLHPKS